YPIALRRLGSMNGHPPADHIAVGNHQARLLAFERSVIKLIEMKQTGFGLSDDGSQKGGGLLKLRLRLLHPFQSKCGGVIGNAGKIVQPIGLLRRWNLAKADQGDSNIPARELCHQLTGVGPDSPDGVCCHQDMHSRSSSGAGCCSWMSLNPVSRNC